MPVGERRLEIRIIMGESLESVSLIFELASSSKSISQGCFSCFSSRLTSESVRSELAANPNLAKSVSLLARRSALHFAAEEGQVEVLMAVTEHLIQSEEESDVSLLLNTRDARGQTPLFIASSMGHFECVRFLLTNGADRALGDSKGNLPLHIACLHGYSLLVMLLLEYGTPEQVTLAQSTVNQGNNSGLRPLHFAVWGRHPNSAVLLLQHGADLSVRAMRQRIPDIVPCHSGTTPLMLAAVRGGVEIARLILLIYYERVVEPMQRGMGEAGPSSEEDPRTHVNENGNMAWEIAYQMGFQAFAAMLRPELDLARLFANRDAVNSRLIGPRSLKHIATVAQNKKLEVELIRIIETRKEQKVTVKPPTRFPPPRLSTVKEQPSQTFDSPAATPTVITPSAISAIDEVNLPGSVIEDPPSSLVTVRSRLASMEGAADSIRIGLDAMETALRTVSELSSAVEQEPWREDALLLLQQQQQQQLQEQPERPRSGVILVPRATTPDFLHRISNRSSSSSSAQGRASRERERERERERGASKEKRASRLGSHHPVDPITLDDDPSGGALALMGSQLHELEVESVGEECGVCFEMLPPVSLQPCRHQVCVDCALRFVVVKVGEERKPCICPFCRTLVGSFDN